MKKNILSFYIENAIHNPGLLARLRHDREQWFNAGYGPGKSIYCFEPVRPYTAETTYPEYLYPWYLHSEHRKLFKPCVHFSQRIVDDLTYHLYYTDPSVDTLDFGI